MVTGRMLKPCWVRESLSRLVCLRSTGNGPRYGAVGMALPRRAETPAGSHSAYVGKRLAVGEQDVDLAEHGIPYPSC